jgi:hypothetical protein
VLDVDDDAPILDDFCPYRDEFDVGPEDEQRLRQSIAVENRERQERVANRVPSDRRLKIKS